MKKIFAIALMMTSLLAWASDVDDGLRAYEKKDYKTAFIKIKSAAEQGLPNAQYLLGHMYIESIGTTQDYKEALRWFRAAAEQGLPNAQLSLGGMYEKGTGVMQDYKEAVRWIRTAAEQGLEMAQYTLAVMYAKGIGVLQDYTYAHMWFNIAATNGDKDAAKGRDLVASKMTSKQISDAQQMAKDCHLRKFKNCN